MKLNGITGLTEFLDKLEVDKVQYGNQFEGALVRCGLLLERYSKAIVPVQTGALKASGGVRVEGSGLSTVVTVYYTAKYALFVHEITRYKHGEAFNTAYAAEIAAAPENDPYWFDRGPNQVSKYLSGPLAEHHDEFLNIIRGAFK